MIAGVAEVRINQEGRSHREVCAIVVTYHPDREFPDRLALILPQVGALIIVDNGSDDAEVTMLRELATHPSITLVLNPSNLGVASALNTGIRQAIARGFAWVLLLDQDSRVAANMLESLFEVYFAFPDRERLAVIGAGFVDVNRRTSEEKAPAPADPRKAPADPRKAPADPGMVHADPWEEVETVITSGSLIPLASHAIVGPFREEFFIDYVDSDYCCRARAKGCSVIQTRRPLMSHAIGAWSKHRVLGMNKWTSNHSSDRRYYIARNDTVMLREYGNYVLGLWALKSISRRFRQCKRIAFYEDMKTRKIIAVLQGWWDGVRGRMGPRVPLLGAAFLCAFAACPSNAWAQSLEPRAYSNTPVGLNFLLAGYDYAEGEVGFDPTVPITGAHLHMDTEFLAFSHTLAAWARSAKVDVLMPYVFLDGSALVAGAPRPRQISGAGDLQFKFAVNLFGAPAMSLKEFPSYHQDLIVGASLKVTAPLSQYDPTKLVNIGTNRWSFKPELGISKALDPWTFDLYTGVTFYTENSDFLNGGTVQRDPIYSAQAHVMRSFSHGIWLAVDGTFYWGGRSTVNDVRTATYQANSRFGTTLAMPISHSMSIKLYAAAGTSTRTHSNFNDAGIAWQYRFGGGF